MTVTDLLQAILNAYPGATPEALATFKPVFYARLQAFEGDKLKTAFEATLGEFKPTARQPFPICADFEAHLPKRLDLGSIGPALDVKGHGDRTRRIMAEWREAQGKRGAQGITEVLRALEFIAEPIASQQAWKGDNTPPLRLTAKQLRLAQHRAISQERNRQHGPIMPSLKADHWWEQIEAIGRAWNIPMTPSEWESSTKTMQMEAAA